MVPISTCDQSKELAFALCPWWEAHRVKRVWTCGLSISPMVQEFREVDPIYGGCATAFLIESIESQILKRVKRALDSSFEMSVLLDI